MAYKARSGPGFYARYMEASTNGGGPILGSLNEGY